MNNEWHNYAYYAAKVLPYFYATDHIWYITMNAKFPQNNEYNACSRNKESLHYTPVETLADHIAPQAMSTGSRALKALLA